MGGFSTLAGAAAGIFGTRDQYDAVADFAVPFGTNYGLASGGPDATAKLNTALATIAARGGGALFFPPGVYFLNSKVTIPADVWLYGTGWDESARQSVLRAGAGMTSLFDFDPGGGQGLLSIQIDDPTPFVTTSVVEVNAPVVNIWEARIASQAAGAPTVRIVGGGARFKLMGGRITNAAGTVFQIAPGTGPADGFIGGGARIVGLLPIHHGGGVNWQYDEVHATGNTSSTGVILMVAGQALFTNMQTDAPGAGASVTLQPGAGARAIASFAGCRHLFANTTDATFPIYLVDASAGGSEASLTSRGDLSEGDATHRALWVVRRIGTDAYVDVQGDYHAAQRWYDTTVQAPDRIEGRIRDDGTGNISRCPTRNVLTANFPDTTGALQNVTGMAFTVAPGERCKFRAVLYFDGLAAQDGQFAFAGPAAPTSIKYQTVAEDAALVLRTLAAAAFGTAIQVGTNGAGVVKSCVVEGELINGANAGTVQLQWAQVVANATPSNLLPGTTLEKTTII